MIHQFKLGGKNIVIDVCSGAIHVVDDVAYDLIALYEQMGKQQIIDVLFDKYNSANVTKEELLEALQVYYKVFFLGEEM